MKTSLSIENHAAAPPRDASWEARIFAGELAALGVQHVCICPGARSTPLALAFAAEPGMRVWSLVDERSAAFFALGIARASGRPPALVCTSGTAAANFFPAVIEASCARVPLLVLTADRPPELRDCGAPQSIDQIKLYGSHVRWFAEAGMPDAGEPYFGALAGRAVAAATGTPAGPVHVNFPFREPLMPASSGEITVGRTAAAAPATRIYPARFAPAAEALDALCAALAQARRGLIVCGPLDEPGFAEAVTALAVRLGLPVLADPLSQVRCGAHDLTPVVAHYEALLRRNALGEHAQPDVVLRFGAMPRCKPLLQFLQQLDCPQWVVDAALPWSDPTLRAAAIVRADAVAVCQALLARLESAPHWSAIDACPRSAAVAALVDADRHAGDGLRARLRASRELNEPRVFVELAGLLPDGTLLYAGNSMPVRDLEAFWPVNRRHVRFLCNHGANGIDGFVSSGLGAAAAHDGPVVMVTGDLGFYHDLNGLLAAHRHRLRATVIVLDNGGGGIFSFLPQAGCGAAFEELFATPHGLDFRHAADLYGAAFHRIASWEQFTDTVAAALGAERLTIIEVPCERERNVELHRELWKAEDPHR